MKPFRHPETNHELGAPRDWNANIHGPCETLPVVVTDLHIISFWQPSEKERADIAAGKAVRLCIWGAGMPPVSVDTEGT